MKILFSFIVMVILAVFFGLTTTSCQFSTNPKDHGLPTMEELMPTVKQFLSTPYLGFSKESRERIPKDLLQEKKFFYKYANKVFMDNIDQYKLDMRLTTILWNNLKKEHPALFQKLKQKYHTGYGDNLLMLIQVYYAAMEKYKDNH